MCLKILLKVTKNQGFTLSLEDTFFEPPSPSPSRFRVNIPNSLAILIVLTTKETLIVVKTIVKTRDPGDEVENNVTNSETLNSETYFFAIFM